MNLRITNFKEIQKILKYINYMLAWYYLYVKFIGY